MAKTSFFAKIKSKFIDKKYSAIYIQKKFSKPKADQSHNAKNRSTVKKYENIEANPETIQRLYKVLNQYEFRIECLQKKKAHIYARLNKQLSQYNKKNQTNLRLQNIICQVSNNDDLIQQEEDNLQFILKQINNGMKNQSYFWMWLQNKVIEAEFKNLQINYQDQFEKVEPPAKADWLQMNAMYLSNYNKQYKSVSQRLQQINEYYSTIQQYLDIKVPKNEAAIAKQVSHETKKLLNEVDGERLSQLGTPCFLKLQVQKYCEKKGFGTKNRKSKNRKVEKQAQNNEKQIGEKLKSEIQQFMSKLDQIKFI